jgi:hypothetical protein
MTTTETVKIPLNYHTPGPWEICQKWPEESKKIQPQGCEIGLAIAYGDTEEEATANARLIAAAPELLAALQKATDWLNELHVDQRPEFLEECCDAITKATGEGVEA